MLAVITPSSLRTDARICFDSTDIECLTTVVEVIREFKLMSQLKIFSSTLGLVHPWQVTAVSFAEGEKRIDITVDYDFGSNVPCPFCGSTGSACITETETWYHDNFLCYATYLHANVPRVECCGVIVPLERPWSRSGSKFELIR